jgi:5-methylcytosine-specific restriction endonuclease McrA
MSPLPPRNTHLYKKQRAQFKARCKAVNAACHICHGELGPIDYYAEPQTSRAFELDHVLPLSTHPHLAYTVSNWAPAHSACNRNRQTKPLQPPPPGKWVRPQW